MVEIEEAEEEGVICKNLTNPIEVVKDENGHVKEVILQVMELGEPDASGRRKPIPVEGKTETPVSYTHLLSGRLPDAEHLLCRRGQLRRRDHQYHVAPV